MDERLRIGFPAAPRAVPAGAPSRSSAGAAQRPGPAQPSAFEQLLEGKLREPVKFSAHAQSRLASTQTRLTEADLARLNEAVDRAEEKGARESLVLMPNVALIVSVKNRTVITAVDEKRIKENIFTNIDSAVII